jgi:hypothetical protein
MLVQLMTSVWETILRLPILPREDYNGDAVRSGDLGLLSEGEVRNGWRELVGYVR